MRSARYKQLVYGSTSALQQLCHVAGAAAEQHHRSLLSFYTTDNWCAPVITGAPTVVQHDTRAYKRLLAHTQCKEVQCTTRAHTAHLVEGHSIESPEDTILWWVDSVALPLLL